MKKLPLIATLIVSIFCASQAFAETAPMSEDVYSFSKSSETQSTEVIENNKIAVNTEDVTLSADVLLADAQTLIRDKLVEKYQVRLDKIMEQLAKKLAGVPAEVQRKALTEVHGRIAEKKTIFLTKNNTDPLKRDITVAILDHITFRIEGMIQQSAQTVMTAQA